MTTRVTEYDISIAVCRILANKISGKASFVELRDEIPLTIALSSEDRVPSKTRHGEELWEQLLRNIVSHKDVEGNFVHDGYLEHISRYGLQITDAGRALTVLTPSAGTLHDIQA